MLYLLHHLYNQTTYVLNLSEINNETEQTNKLV